MKRSAVITLLLGMLLALLPAPASAAPYCGITWGSTPDVAQVYSTGQLVDVRAGRHACFDRLVLDVRGDVSGYHVRYVDQVSQDGSDTTVPVRGGASLQVVATVPSHDEQYRSTYPITRTNLVDVTGFRTFRQVAGAGSFEGQSTVGLGVRARLPFRAFVLDGPGSGSRLVVDVAHSW